MKTARFVLKIVGAALAVAGVACLIVGYWDKLTGCCTGIPARKCRSEFDDYADVD